MSGRNNDERTGASQSNESDATAAVQAAVQQTNQNNTSGLNFVIPTEFVELPSGGKYYAEGHPLHNESTIEIKFMTAKDEDILTSRSLLKKGLAINRFLQNIIVNRNVKVDDLIIGDKNAILTAARISGYGADYVTNATCPACGTNDDHTFNLEDGRITGFHTDTFDANSLPCPVEDNGNGTFNLLLPRSQVNVTVRVLTGKDEAALAQAVNSKKKSARTSVIGHDTSMTDQMRTYIAAVNGSDDSRDIYSFVNAMPAADSRTLRTAYTAIMPNFDLRQLFSCDTCGYEQDMEVPFTSDFFWPKQ